MVQRNNKRSRKYLGSRRWGGGNIKSRRGKGSRGGVGKGGTKHKWSYTVVYARETIGKKGFKPWRPEKQLETDIRAISGMASTTEPKPTIELRGYKVLSQGNISRPVIVKASGFSKKAEEKIRKAGGEAVKL